MKMFFYFIFFTLIFISCRVDHNFYYDMNSGKLKSCDKKRLRNLSIKYENNSVIKLRWSDTINEAPKELDLGNIPIGYELRLNGKLIDKKFRLKSNSFCLIEKWGGGGVSFNVKIWTNSEGEIYKTSHSKCN